MELITYLVSVLAVYRISYLVVNPSEIGPFGLFQKTRNFVASSRYSWVREGFSCILCVSFWLSAIPAIVIAPTVLEAVLFWFGIAGSVLVLFKVLK